MKNFKEKTAIWFIAYSSLFLSASNSFATEDVNFTGGHRIEIEYVAGSAATARNVDFKSLKRDGNTVKINISSRKASEEVTNLFASKLRAVSYISNLKGTRAGNICDHGTDCNFLVNAKLYIDGQLVDGDIVLAQGHRYVPEGNEWSFGVQDNPRNKYGFNEEGPLFLTTDAGTEYAVRANKNNNTFDIVLSEETIPSGSYQDTCKVKEWNKNAGDLTAECETKKGGSYHKSLLNTKQCAGKDIYNDHGTLAC